MATDEINRIKESEEKILNYEQKKEGIMKDIPDLFKGADEINAFCPKCQEQLSDSKDHVCTEDDAQYIMAPNCKICKKCGLTLPLIGKHTCYGVECPKCTMVYSNLFSHECSKGTDDEMQAHPYPNLPDISETEWDGHDFVKKERKMIENQHKSFEKYKEKSRKIKRIIIEYDDFAMDVCDYDDKPYRSYDEFIGIAVNALVKGTNLKLQEDKTVDLNKLKEDLVKMLESFKKAIGEPTDFANHEEYMYYLRYKAETTPLSKTYVNPVNAKEIEVAILEKSQEEPYVYFKLFKDDVEFAQIEADLFHSGGKNNDEYIFKKADFELIAWVKQDFVDTIIKHVNISEEITEEIVHGKKIEKTKEAHIIPLEFIVMGKSKIVKVNLKYNLRVMRHLILKDDFNMNVNDLEWKPYSESGDRLNLDVPIKDLNLSPNDKIWLSQGAGHGG